MGVFAGAEQALVDDWVRTRLTAATAELEAISTGLTQRVFDNFAPSGTGYPFIVFHAQTPVRDVRGVGTATVMVTTTYVVKAIAQVTSYTPLAPLAAAINRAMTEPQGSAHLDGHIFTSVREDQFALVEYDNGKEYRHLGGSYSIQAQG